MMTSFIEKFHSKIGKIYLTFVIRKNYLKRKIVKFRKISSKLQKWNLTAFDNPIFIIMKSN